MSQSQQSPDSLIKQKAIKAKEALNDLVDELHKSGMGDHFIEGLKRLSGQLGQISREGATTFFTTFYTSLLKDDSAREERLRIHKEIGEVLAGEMGISSKEGLFVSYYLMGKGDLLDLTQDNIVPQPPSQMLLKQAMDLLLKITLQYAHHSTFVSQHDEGTQSASSRRVSSTIEIYLRRPNSPPPGVVRKEIRYELDRDQLPSEIRADLIRENKPITYKLYPSEVE